MDERTRVFVQTQIDKNRGQKLPKASAIGDVLVWDGDKWVDSRSETPHIVGSSSSEPAFTNAWVNVAGFAQIQFYKGLLGRVWLEGVASNPGGLGKGNGTSIFTLPVGYRPPATVQIATRGAGAANGAGAITITATGTVTPTLDALAGGAAVTTVTINGSFRAA